MTHADADHRAHMDGIYRYQRYIYDATRKYYLLGRDRLLDDLKPPPSGTILEIGCGTGRNLILAARRYPHARLYGFDISSEMLKSARTSIDRAGLSDRVFVAEGDATAFDTQALFSIPSFDRVFISYALSMIPPWRQSLRPALAAVAPGGRLHIVDFGQQAGWPKWFRAVLFAWLARFSVSPRADLEQALAEASSAVGASLKFERLYRGYADYAVLTRPA
ncbi:MAG: class I SAM-dependent methyltransferase [Hyphomicrobiaceae bacterium]